MLKKLILLMFFVKAFSFADDISLEQLRNLALENSELNNKLMYNESIMLLQDKNLRTNYLPKVSFTARATYQSDVFSLPITLPETMGAIPEISKDQYNLQFDINQTIYDGGITNAAREMKVAEIVINNSAVAVNLYQINKVINELYFGVLIIDANLESLNLIEDDISSKRKALKSSVDNGVLLQSDLNALDIQLGNIESSNMELKSNRQSLVQMLEKWTGTDLQDASFTMPESPDLQVEKQRPEIALFESRQTMINKQKKMIMSDYMPKLGAFVQAGYGKPTPVNFFDDEFTSYYKLGLQLQWELWEWNTHKRETEIAEINKKSIEAEKQNFLKAKDIEIVNYLNNIDKYKSLIDNNAKMITLQKENTDVVFSKLKNGTVTSTAYVSEQSILNKMLIENEIYKIELLKNKYDLIYTKGGFNNFYGDK